MTLDTLLDVDTEIIQITLVKHFGLDSIRQLCEHTAIGFHAIGYKEDMREVTTLCNGLLEWGKGVFIN